MMNNLKLVEFNRILITFNEAYKWIPLFLLKSYNPLITCIASSLLFTDLSIILLNIDYTKAGCVAHNAIRHELNYR